MRKLTLLSSTVCALIALGFWGWGQLYKENVEVQEDLNQKAIIAGGCSLLAISFLKKDDSFDF